MKYRTLPLSQGQVALLDAEDYEHLGQYKWHAWRSARSGAFYARRNILIGTKRTVVYLHRQVMGLSAGDLRQVDHINQAATLDNRKCNLRIASVSQNLQNARVRSDNSSGYKGVSWCRSRKKWKAEIHKDRQYIFLGYYSSKEEAASAYRQAAQKLFGAFARL